MESPDLPSRSSAGEECLGHDGTLKLLESWREILRGHHVKADSEISHSTITVSVGPQYEGNISRSARGGVKVKQGIRNVLF